MKENCFSSNVVALRKQKKLTTAKVAQSLKVTEETVVAWELGMKEPQAKDVIKIAKFYGVDTSDLVNTSLFGVQEEPKKNNNENQKVYKTSKKSLVFQAIIMILSAFTLITFALDCFEVDLLGLKVTITLFDLLVPEEFVIETLFCWLILLFVLYNIVNAIILLSSNTARNSKYSKISQVLLFSFNSTALVLWIITAIRNRGLDFKFVSIWLFIVFALNLILLLFANIRVNNNKFDTNKIKKIVFYVLAGLVLLGLVYITFHISFTELYIEYDYDNSFRERYLSTIYGVISLLPVIASVVITILLMIKKLLNNPSVRRGLGITGIVLSVLMSVVVYTCVMKFVDNIANIDYYYIYDDGIHEIKTFTIITSIVMLIASIIALTIKNKDTQNKQINKK